jgi:hypothetical protein
MIYLSSNKSLLLDEGRVESFFTHFQVMDCVTERHDVLFPSQFVFYQKITDLRQ